MNRPFCVSTIRRALTISLVVLSAAPGALGFEGFNAMHIRPPVVDESIRGARAKRVVVDVELAFDRRWRPPDGELLPWVQSVDRPARLVGTTRITIDLVVDNKRRQALRVRVPYTAAGTTADGLGPAHPDRVEAFLNGEPTRWVAADQPVVRTEGPSRQVSAGQWTEKGKTELSYTFVFTHGITTRAIYSWEHSDPHKGFKALVDEKTQIEIHLHSREPWIADSQVELVIVGPRGVVASPGVFPFADVDKVLAKRMRGVRTKGHHVSVWVKRPGRDEPGIALRRAAETECHQRPEHHYVWRNGLCLRE